MAKHDRRGADHDPASFTEFRIRQPVRDAVVADESGEINNLLLMRRQLSKNNRTLYVPRVETMPTATAQARSKPKYLDPLDLKGL